MCSILFLRLVTCYLLLGLACSQGDDCEAEADILIIMDSSGSIGATDYNKMLIFVANLTHNFTIGPKAIQFSAILFGSAAQNLFNFGTYTDHQSLENAILRAPYLSESTATDTALRFGRLQSFTSVYGARPGVARIAIVLTDGGSNEPNSTAREAQLIKNAGVTVFSIGIGASINQVELNTIASSRADVFTVNNFNILHTIATQVTNKTCEQVILPPKLVLACDAQADILFIIASSSRTDRANYTKITHFVQNITRNFNIGPNAIQFSTIVFGNNATLVFDFKKYTDYLELEKGILGTPYLAHSIIRTDTAIDLARQQAFTTTHGARIGVSWIAVVITDGASADPAQTIINSNLLKNYGVRVLSVGIGQTVVKSELEKTATYPTDVFAVNTYDELDEAQPIVTNTTCEEVVIPRNENKTCNVTQEADILFILDSSGSIPTANFNLMLHFVVNVTRYFNIGPQEVQFAAINFGTDATEVFDFKSYTTHAGIEQGILGIKYLQGLTNTDKALKMAREQMFQTAKGYRQGVPKIVIILTHGGSTNKNATVEQAQMLINFGALVMSVGIGNAVNQQELQAIASFEEDVFQVTDFDVLNVIQRQMTNKTCVRVTETQPLCSSEADVLFIIESSSRILANNYNNLLNFVVNLTQSFNIGPQSVQFGIIIFSDNALDVLDFNTYTNHSALEQGILSTPHLQGAAYTNKALQLARETMFTSAKGSRPQASKIAIVLTDGQSTRSTDTAIQARLLKNSGALVLSIGIGSSVNKEELETIASLPSDVFQASNFDVLDTIQAQVTNKTCERVTDDKPHCPAVADILFIMDSTGSIGKENYNKMLTFIANFTRNFAIGPNWAQFSGITFADTPHSEFSFGTYKTHSDLEKGILKSTYFGETTQTDLALQMAREHSFTPANGARPEAEKIAIVLTDGRSNDPEVTAMQAKLLKDSGVLVLTIAIGADILNRELEAIATLPEDIFHVEHFDILETIEKEFAKQACDRVTQTIACEAKADILFILDSSASITPINYAKMLNFVANLTGSFDLGPKAVQFSTIIFGDDANIEFDFGRYNNHPSLEQALLHINYLAQNTFTNRALMLARLEAFSAAHGARGNVSKIAIILTDGQSSLPTETTREAELLKETGVLLLSVGIGDTVRQSELEILASTPADVFQVNSFNVLSTVQKSLTNKTCDNVISGQQTACSKLADIIFLLDSSGSVSTENYRRQQSFAANFTDNFQIGIDDARFGAIIFSDNATKLFDLKDYSDHWSILRSLLAAPHLKGGTNTADALSMIFNDELFNTSAGGRNNALKMLVIMTDGQSDNVTQSLAAAQRLKNMGVQIMTIGVGDVVNVAELNGMASSPSDVFQATSYEALHKLQEEVTNHTCGFIRPPVSVIQHACSELADIIFIIDSSSSIKPDDFQKQLLFASNLTQDFDIGPVDARFGAVVFSNDVFKVFDLGTFTDYFNLYNGLLNSPHLTGSADIGKALNWVNDMGMFDPPYGGRVNSSKIIIVFANDPAEDQSGAIHAADRLKKDGVHISVVGIDDYDLFEIRQIASSPQSAFKATSVDSLHWIQRNLVDDVCDFASTQPYIQ